MKFSKQTNFDTEYIPLGEPKLERPLAIDSRNFSIYLTIKEYESYPYLFYFSNKNSTTKSFIGIHTDKKIRFGKEQ